MKKPLRYMLSLVLMLALMLSMGTAAFADKTDSGLPVEYVSYGVGLSDAPGVDKHGLSDDDITIDGVSWRTDTTEDALHVHVLDLAAAKLLRCCADEAKELGLDYAKLYIENGLIHVKEDVPAEEAGGLKEKLDELTRAAVIGLVSGDAFDVGNGGEAKLQVKIAGFATVAQETEAAKSGLKVEGIGMSFNDGRPDLSGITGDKFAGVTTTTIYIAYGGVTRYSPSASCNNLYSEEASQEISYDEDHRRYGVVGVAKEAGDENNYYIKIIGIDDEPEFIRVDDLASMGDDVLNATVANIVGEDGETATKIIVATDPDGNNIVMTIKLKDGTAKPEDIPVYAQSEDDPDGDEPGNPNDPLPNAVPGEDENAESGEASGEGGANKAPEGYNEPKEVGSNLQYTPKNPVEPNPTGEDTADVTVRDTVIVPNPNPSCW